MRMTVAAMALLAATPAAGQPRDLAVPPDKAWQHAATGVVLTPTLRGLPRTALRDSGDDELDVSAQFNDPALDTSLTVYVFRPALPSTAVWFDRAATQIALRDVYGTALATTMPTPFARPGATVAAGLRQVFAPTKGHYRSTAVALAPLGAWLVAVRISSATLSPTAMAGELDATLAAIRWPAATSTPDGPAAVPIAACPTELPVSKAKLLKQSVQNGMLDGLLATVAASKATRPIEAGAGAALCRDGNPTLSYAMYRAPDAADGYTLAIGDAGQVVRVVPPPTLGPAATAPRYSVMFQDLDGRVDSYAAFDRLPLPEQVLRLVQDGTPTTRTTRKADGNIEVNVALPKR